MTTPAGAPTSLPGACDGLGGPVPVALTKAVEQVPAAGALPGGCVFEPKWDGFRMVAARKGSGVRLWSRQGKELTARFPDVARAAARRDAGRR